MDKNLTVYPISSGDELNVYSITDVICLRILDMKGGIVCGPLGITGTNNTIDIKSLAPSTYIVEVDFADSKKGRSVFVKI